MHPGLSLGAPRPVRAQVFARQHKDSDIVTSLFLRHDEMLLNANGQRAISAQDTNSSLSLHVKSPSAASGLRFRLAPGSASDPGLNSST